VSETDPPLQDEPGGAWLSATSAGEPYYETCTTRRAAEGGKVQLRDGQSTVQTYRVDKEKIKDDPRFRLGMPSTDNANYLWIQIFYHALNERAAPAS